MISPLWKVGCSLFTTLLVVFWRSRFVLNAAKVPARLRKVIRDASNTAVGISTAGLDYYPGRTGLSGLFDKAQTLPCRTGSPPFL
jgi:hypothetical protein